MNDPDASAEPTLADKLNHLFRTVVPAGREPYSTEEVARAITAGGVPISGSYIWLLRKGQRNNPTLRHVEALAKFFGVPPAYFFDDQVTAAVNADLRLLVALKDTQVQRVALRAAGLSPESLHSINEVIERVRELEGLPTNRTRPPDRNP
ncbi:MULTISPECIES: helix-turn-helix domain-containing protein [Streptomyces]|uniref:Helix-turn-helix transcriptional regulator n=2 Tax=Streptomyces TaxID=1883 RepID=A0A939FRZ9_9ACTN|nr:MULTISPECIES: helix-turn-helix domain-containing protein [Streptomyces]MBO0656289.1 helix-turn-helix transcriptional regulator [Streptomyces triculaminicus]QSY50270.1 helix-turn-helix transcriptional regulator [Streptomyces griseocarneus]